MSEGATIDFLISEYRELARLRPKGQPEDSRARDVLTDRLVTQHDWTEEGARELLALVDEYGAFALRNALAVAVVLGIEDGSRGL